MNNAIPLSYPDITDAEINAVTRVLRSGRLSLGPCLEAFEEAVARRADRAHGVGVSSGTAGLHLALIALGVQPGDEVITPAFSFAASANCIEYVGAKPVFVDCDPRTLNMKGSDIESHLTDRTRAVIAVEVFGNPAGMDAIAATCNRFELPLIEDACEGLGGRLGRQPIGSFGRVGIFSFYPNKQITTGEGGVIVTDDDHIADRCRSLRNQGRPARTGAPATSIDDVDMAELGTWLTHEDIGFNFRLSELHAALGEAQMRRLDQIVEERERVSEAYTRRLGGNTDLILPTVDDRTLMSWFVYVVRLSHEFGEDDRNYIIEGLRRHDVGAADYFPPVPLLPYYASKYGYEAGDFPVAESVGNRTIALPFFNRLTEREIDLVCQTLELMITRITFARR